MSRTHVFLVPLLKLSARFLEVLSRKKTIHVRIVTFGELFVVQNGDGHGTRQDARIRKSHAFQLIYLNQLANTLLTKDALSGRQADTFVHQRANDLENGASRGDATGAAVWFGSRTGDGRYTYPSDTFIIEEPSLG